MRVVGHHGGSGGALPLVACDVEPICAGPSFDACAAYKCACDGTIIIGCGAYEKPWQYGVTSEDAGSCVPYVEGGVDAGDGGDGGS